MSDALDILCLAAGHLGAVMIMRGRVAVCAQHGRVLDVEHHDGRHDRGQAIRALSGRLTPQRRGR